MKNKFQNEFKSIQLDEGYRHLTGTIGTGVGIVSGLAHSTLLPRLAPYIIAGHMANWGSYLYGEGLKDDIDFTYKKHQKNLQTYGPDHPETKKTKNELNYLSSRTIFVPHILGNLYYRALHGKWTASGEDYLRELKRKEKKNKTLSENNLSSNSEDQKDKIDPLKLITTNQRFSRQLAVPLVTSILRTPLSLLGISDYLPPIPELLAIHYAYRTGLKKDLQYRLNKYIENRNLHGENHPETIKYKTEYNNLAPTLKKAEKQHKWFMSKVKSLTGKLGNRIARTGKRSTIPFLGSNVSFRSKIPPFQSNLPVYGR